jgi:hypothetical protein
MLSEKRFLKFDLTIIENSNFHGKQKLHRALGVMIVDDMEAKRRNGVKVGMINQVMEACDMAPTEEQVVE